MAELTGRLLVVDDDENNRDMFSRRLERRGYSVATASDGFDALRSVDSHPFDLILLDIEMPGISGLDVLRQLRQTRPATQLPIIIATARGDRDDVLEALRLGANDYVTKPLDFPVVAARVETQLSHKRAVDRIIALEQDLRLRNVELEDANERMRRSLLLAGRMQQSLLPADPLEAPGLQFAWIYEPCDELGGDILSIFPLGEHHIGLYLLDVSGHGVPAALLSVTLSRMLAPIANQPSLVQRQTPDGLEPRSPAEVAGELNRRFPMVGVNSQYFTLFYGVFDVRARRLTYVSAGHPPALHLKAGGESAFAEGHGFAVGWFHDAQFEENVVDLREGDRFVLYSDGITETLNGESESFGNQRLAAVCSAARNAPLDSSLQSLLGAVHQFRGASSSIDDVSAMALQVTTQP